MSHCTFASVLKVRSRTFLCFVYDPYNPNIRAVPFLDCFLYPYKHIVYIVLHMLQIYFLDSFFLFIKNLT